MPHDQSTLFYIALTLTCIASAVSVLSLAYSAWRYARTGTLGSDNFEQYTVEIEGPSPGYMRLFTFAESAEAAIRYSQIVSTVHGKPVVVAVRQGGRMGEIVAEYKRGERIIQI